MTSARSTEDALRDEHAPWASVATPLVPPSFGARAGVRLIEAYQAQRRGRPSPCRFLPTCSHYGVEALSVHGLWRGGWMTARRLLRCRPGGPAGVDLVPAPRAHNH